jgi:DNA-binding CsgD family transcriptional regulator
MATVIHDLSYRESAALHSPGPTQHELRVLQMAADGETCESTSQVLGIAVTTVKNQRGSVMIKLGADNITHAVAMGMRRGLIK